MWILKLFGIAWRFQYSRWELVHSTKNENHILEIYKRERHKDSKPQYKKIEIKF